MNDDGDIWKMKDNGILKGMGYGRYKEDGRLSCLFALI